MSDAIKLTVASEPTLSLGVGSDGVSPSQFADLEKWLRDQWSAVEAEVDTAIDGVEHVDASVTKTGGTATIAVTGRDGNTRTATVHDGDTGPAGYSPTVAIASTNTEHTVTITDAQGPHSYTVPTYADEEAERAQEWDVLAQEAQDATDAANAAAAGITDANLPSLLAGAARSLTGDEPTEATFLSRACPGTDGPARIESIKGRTLVWNQLVPTNAASRTSNGITTRATDGVYTVSGTGTLDSGNAKAVLANIAVPTGHKMFAAIRRVSAGATNSGGISVTDGYTNEFSPGYPTQDAATIFECTTGTVRFTTQAALTTLTMDMTLTPQLFDLTAMFGAGNEPATVDEFEAMFPEPYYPYDAGSLLPVRMTGVESVGFNQWDEEWEVGGIYSDTGGNNSSTSHQRSKNYIPVFQNTQYYIKCPAQMNVYFYDINKKKIGITYKKDAKFTTPDGCRYIRFVDNETNAWVGYNNDVCINISDPSRNGTYEPYWRSERAIPASTYFPDGMRSAGSVCDELTEREAVTRVGSVTLNGSEFWTKSSSYPGGYFISEWAANNSIVSTVNHVQNRFTTVASIDGYKEWTCYFDRSINLRVPETVAPTVTDFVAWLAEHPVTVHYALATPTATPIDPSLNLTYKAAQGGTERVMHTEQSAPPTMVVAYGYTAASLLDAAASTLADPDGPTATANHAVGSYLTMGGTLYRVTRAIATGERIVPGTNATATTVMAEILSLIQ